MVGLGRPTHHTEGFGNYSLGRGFQKGDYGIWRQLFGVSKKRVKVWCLVFSESKSIVIKQIPPIFQ